MPARSKSQQRLFGMVHAYQKGKLKNAPEEVRSIARSISEEDAEHFAKTKHKGLPEKKAAYLQGFMDKLAEHGMTKEAKNITKLLSRIGPDLSGATARDLKFIARRGFKGFTPEQVRALRAKGLLPSIEQELEGFNKGTENMLKWTPKAKTPRPVVPPKPSMDLPYEKWRPANDAYWSATNAQEAWDKKNFFTSPAGSIVRTNDPAVRYSSSLHDRKVVIPDTSVPGTLTEREMRAAVARHEAREWVRGNAQLAKGRDVSRPGSKGVLGMFARPEVGSSHIPGVIYDERVFRSQLLNRLGSDVKWDKAPLGPLNPSGTYSIRGARDSFVGSKPLPYEFARMDEWRAISRRQAQEMRRLRTQAFRRGVRGPISPEMEKSVNELLSNPELQAAGITPQQARRLIAARAAGFDEYRSVNRILGDRYAEGVSEAKRDAIKKLEHIVSDGYGDEIPELLARTPAYKELDGALKGRGLSRDKYIRILRGDTIDVPADSVLGKIRNMSFYADHRSAKKLPDLISENPSLVRRILSMLGIGK